MVSKFTKIMLIFNVIALIPAAAMHQTDFVIVFATFVIWWQLERGYELRGIL